MTTTGARRGRPEALLDPGVPEHRRVLAQRLRDLRTECHAPPYRILSGLSHCAAGTLSEAAAGRRLPTWETTQAYVTGCLRHAGREAELSRVLPRWRVEWERAALAEMAPPEPAPTVVTVIAEPPARHRPHPVRLALAAVLLLLCATALPSSGPAGPPPMTGLYNIVLTPPVWQGGGADPELAGRVHRSIGAELSAWAGEMSSIQLRRPARVPAPDSTLPRIAERNGADVVLRPTFKLSEGRLGTTIEIFIADRTLAETPEFAGRHDISLTEPADGVTASTRRYLGAVVLFVRGVGAYAKSDFPAAEQQLRQAAREFDAVATAVGDPHLRREVVHLMIGNAVGAQDPARAAGYFRQALAEDSGYRRAEIGLAEALRAPDPCQPELTDAGRLHEAAAHYQRSLDLGSSPLLDMKTHLGLGLTAQCLSLAGAERGWDHAEEEFAAVLALQKDAGTTAASARHARWLAAEARAGQALNAMAGARDYAGAAAGYEQALAILAGIGVLRSTYLERQLVFLHNLRFAYEKIDDTDGVMRTDQRIDETDRRLSALPTARR